MSVHKFGMDTGQHSPGVFNSILESYRSDVEQRHTPVAIHDPDSKDVQVARRMAEEMIHVSGAEIKLFARTENADYDVVWDEDPDPTYWTPHLMKAFFRPEPIHTELTKWGADTKNRTEVIFSHYQLYDRLGERMVRTGDVLQLPYNAAAISPRNFRVVNATPSGNFRYVWLYITCQVETLTADMAVRPEEDLPLGENTEVSDWYHESI